MSPTLFRAHGMRFAFFTREEERPHVHVTCAEGDAKFWLEPRIEIAHNHGLSPRRLSMARRLITERRDEIRSAWRATFGR